MVACGWPVECRKAWLGSLGSGTQTACAGHRLLTRSQAPQHACQSGPINRGCFLAHPLVHSGRWVLPFRACWNAAGDGVIVGNMNRFVDIFDAGSGALAGQVRRGREGEQLGMRCGLPQ